MIACVQMAMTLQKFSSAMRLHFARAALQMRLWLHRCAHIKWRKYDVVDFGFLLVLCASVGLLVYMISEISISYKEFIKLHSSESWLFVWLRVCVEIFGSSDYALRFSLIVVHIGNMSLMYLIGRIYLRKRRDSLFLVLLYALLPGVNLSALLLYESGFIIFVLLAICFVQLRFKKIPYVLICLAGLLDLVFCVLFIALGVYAILHRKSKMLLTSLVGFGVNMFLYSSSIAGVPQAYALDVLGAFAMLFSPLLFLYYIYTLYAAITRHKDYSLMVLISISGLIFSLLLSLRQEIDITKFAPLCVVGLPVLVYGFYNDMRVRLKMYRTRFRVRMGLVFLVLCFESFCLFGNKITYLFSPQPNFARSYYIAKDVANALKSRGIEHLKVENSALALRLSFYGIEAGSAACLYEESTPISHKGETIEIAYLGKVVARYKLVRSNACRI